MSKKKMLLELTESQSDCIKNIAKSNNIYQVDVIRKLIDLVCNLQSDDTRIFACDTKNLKSLDNFAEVKDMSLDKTMSAIDMKLSYSKKNGVKCDISLAKNIYFGG